MSISIVRKDWKGIIISVLVGLFAMVVQKLTAWPILDPLVVAMILGMTIRSLFSFKETDLAVFRLTPSVFIPMGVIFYGAASLNFTKFAAVDPDHIFVLLIVFIVYIISAYFLSNLLGLNDKTAYLIAAGSAICGASAIAITSRSIDAEPDDVSNSLVPVFLSAIIGLYVILPVVTIFFEISDVDFGVLSGTVLQFTGFVKASVATHAEEVKSLALSVKAVRYVGLIFIIPLFASFVKGKFTIPWYLWAYLGAGIILTLLPDLAKILRPTCKFILTILWSIAMGAIGLNANLKTLFTKVGIKAFLASFIAFLIAVGVFVSGVIFM